MVNNEFYWYEIDDTNKVGNQVIIPLELSDVKKAIGLYLVNPIERSKIKDLDKLIRNIERNTKVNMISDDDNEKWSDDKMGFFREDLLNPAYQDIMNSRLKELLQTYVPNEEKRKWESFEDFKTTDIDSKLTLGDLLDSNEEKEFIGETIVVGRSDKSTTQKKLLDNERMLTNDEFFGLKPRDDAVLSSINVKYTDEGIHGPEVQFLGRSLPATTGFVPFLGSVAGAAAGVRYGGSKPIRRGLYGGFGGLAAGNVLGNLLEGERRRRNAAENELDTL